MFAIRPDRYTVGDSTEELLRCTPTDVVACLSVAHHFALGRGSVSVDEFRNRLAKATRHVLFFDTGEAHEAWIGRYLPEWTPEHIAKWLKAAGFDEVVALGIDRDNIAPHEGNYGRTLFACLRNDTNAATRIGSSPAFGRGHDRPVPELRMRAVVDDRRQSCPPKSPGGQAMSPATCPRKLIYASGDPAARATIRWESPHGTAR